MVNIKKILTKLISAMSVVPAINNGKHVTITNNTITPTKNGWLRVTANVVSPNPALNPVIRVSVGNETIAEQLGTMYAGSAINLGIPVRAGYTYTIECFRCTLNAGASRIFPEVGGGNKLPYPLNRIAQILLWRKEVGVC